MAMVMPRGISGSWAAILARRRKELTGRLSGMRRTAGEVEPEGTGVVEPRVGVDGG
jgi:hypothetical protein